MSGGMDALAAVKGGAVVAGGSVAAELVIFNDPLYATLAIAGALVSAVGVLHEVYTNPTDKVHKEFIVLESVKGLLLGLIATPIYFLALMHGGSGLVEKFLNIDSFKGIGNSFWFLLSLMLSWWTTPIMGGLRDIAVGIKGKINRILGGKNG